MSDSNPSSQHAPTQQGAASSHLKSIGIKVLDHFKKHVGIGIVCAVAYFDPGNWGVDLQAGSQFGYRLLFVVLLAGLFAVFLQVLAGRLGCVTGLDLASHSRLLLYNRPKHTLLYRWLGLYPLYVLAEIAIIATDLAELLGSAIALCMLFPSLELWQGVLLTAVDVIIILAMGDPLRGRPVRMFEFLIAGMVIAVVVCMVVIISKVHVNWANAFDGYIPSKHIFASGGLYTSVGILGATVMPHSLFLGSALATQDRIEFRPEFDVKLALATADSEPSGVSEQVYRSWLLRMFDRCKESVLVAFRVPPPSAHGTVATRHSEHENNPFLFVKAHIYHGTLDLIGSLLGFAVMINSLILILAAAVFYFGSGSNGMASPASLFDAYDLIQDLVGKPAATLFAIALLAAGQSSSIIATIAGQAVAEGFLQWRVSPVVRRLVTRLLAIVPSVVVAVAVGRSGVDTLLVASQVVLSIVLPFITLPLLWCTASKAIMSVRKLPNGTPFSAEPETESPPSPAALESANGSLVDFSNNKVVIVVGGCIWLVVVAANMYVIVTLAMGTTT